MHRVALKLQLLMKFKLIMNNFFLLLCFIMLLCLPYRTESLHRRNATHQQVLGLLSFKSMVSDPDGSLLSWNFSTHMCRWKGVGCGHKHPERIVELNLNCLGLSGHISPFLGNLTYLKALDLGENQLVGQIPHELGYLGKLQVLNLTSNSLEGRIPESLGRCIELVNLNLANNLFHGEIPGEIGNLKNLKHLGLRTNVLSGTIPASLGNLSSLTVLSLGNNSLSGEVPFSIGNISNLEAIFVWKNNLSGGVPSSIGRLSNLQSLDLEDNNLSGTIPPAIWNISSLVVFAVSGNQFTGTIPPYAFSVLPLIQIFYAGENLFHGHLPPSLSNASHLIDLEIPFNNLSGVVPPQLEGLLGLKRLVLSFNVFEAKEPQDWNFMAALTNCSQLQLLQLDSCKFSGVIPSALSNLSTSLKFLTLTDNKISGHIPKDIGNLVNLEILLLTGNYLTGSIPSSFSMLQNLKFLSLENNKLTGPVRHTIGNLSQLNDLSLSMNAFTESIPATLGNMTSLLKLNLSHNSFSGMIPPSIFNITTLSIYFGISNNHLEGPIPPEVGNLQNLVEFDAKFNNLSGGIPPSLGKCMVLQILSLQNNSFIGHIPSLLIELKGLEILDISSNNFSGEIPKFLGSLSALSSLNLSYNNFDGEVPIAGVFSNASRLSVLGNKELCGGIADLHLPPCSPQYSKKRHISLVWLVCLPAVATMSIISLLLFFLGPYNKRSTESDSAMYPRGHKIVSYAELVHATDGFSTTNLLGTGSYGSVYRGKLYSESGANEHIVAIKVLKLQTAGALKSFAAECEAMRNLRHRNLVPIVTACSSIDFNGNDFKAIVFDFMSNGSLDDWLHPGAKDRPEKRHMSLNLRVGILYDVACALDYLHFHAGAPVVHCDLKPSNVLLDAGMVAHVGDFGVAKILAQACSRIEPTTSSLGFRGTIGYAPPEYAAGNMVTTHGDIYSYGVLVLETMTGRRPTDNTIHGVLGLRSHVEMALNNCVMDIIDRQLVMEVEDEAGTQSSKIKANSMVSLLHMGMLCSVEIPSCRMATKEIIKELQVIRRTLA